MTDKERLMTLLRHRTKHMYDVQKLRIQVGNRESSLTIEVTDDDRAFLDESSKMLEAVEKHALRDLKRMLEGVEIAQWLMEQRGIAETMAAVLVSYFNIEKCGTVSKMWAWAGLAVVNGEADRRRKGEKARYDPWLKSKVLAVMGGNLIKAVGRDPAGYYTSASLANPDFVASAKKPVKPKKKRKGSAEELFEANVSGEDVPSDIELDQLDAKYVLRLHEDRVPTEAELRSVGAPAWKKTITVRRPFSGQIVDPNTGQIQKLPWRSFYDNYKTRKEHTQVAVCMGCNGTGSFKLSSKESERLEKLAGLPVEKLRPEEVDELAELRAGVAGKTGCTNCNGTGGPAPWGRSAAHRHAAAQRYLVKMFLMAFWEKWRRIEGLEVRRPYAEEYLGRTHHA